MPDRQFKPGDDVAITSGVYEGFVGKLLSFEGDSVVVALDIFGRKANITVPKDSLGPPPKEPIRSNNRAADQVQVPLREQVAIPPITDIPLSSPADETRSARSPGYRWPRITLSRAIWVAVLVAVCCMVWQPLLVRARFSDQILALVLWIPSLAIIAVGFKLGKPITGFAVAIAFLTIPAVAFFTFSVLFSMLP